MQRGHRSPAATRAAAILALSTTLLAGVLFAAARLPGAAPASSRASNPAPSRAVFERRILPIFRAKNPSTCSECHLSGVDLKDYIRPTEAATFAVLRDRGMLDVKRPENSRILKFIRMSRPETPLVTQKVRGAEYAAFRDWIVAAAKDPKLARASAEAPSPAAVPVPVIRHTRIDAVVASFEQNVWSQQGRCMNCHQAGTPDNDKNVQKYGPRVAWCKPDSAEKTMRVLIAQGDVDVDRPDQSLLLLKPLGKLPHGGGVKMLYGDAGYKMFRAWLEDYAASVKGTYRAENDLPAPAKDRLVDMNTILAVSNGPLPWKARSLRVDVYPWDGAKNAWAQKPAATGERGMFAGDGAQATSTNLIMFLIVPTGGATGEKDRLLSSLGQGRYLLRYYVDTTGKLDKDYTIPTNDPGFIQGQQEVSAAWNREAGWSAPVKVVLNMKKSTR